MVNNLDLLNNCTGCTACVNTCKQRALHIGLSDEGYLRPIVDGNLCVKCEKCVDLCLGIKEIKSYTSFKFYSAQAIDEQVLLDSTSGGVFQLLARKAFQEGWNVFGPIYKDGMKLEHVRAKDIIDIKKMGGSKYVQSDASNSMLEIKQLLLKRQKVLFSGTPCQIAGLKTFLKIELCSFDEDNLLTIDFPCYGIPSVKFFKDNVEYYEKKYHAKMVDFRFRDKKKNGFSHTTVIKLEDHKKAKEITINDYRKIPYHYAFGERNCFQKKCYNCDFIKFDRVSDITLGSFWGIEKIRDDYEVKKGVSMVCLNTNLGETKFNEILEELLCFEQTAQEVYCANEGLTKKVPIGNRNVIMNDYANYGYKYIVKRYYKLTLKKRIISKLSDKQIEFLKRIVKKRK